MLDNVSLRERSRYTKDGIEWVEYWDPQAQRRGRCYADHWKDLLAASELRIDLSGVKATNPTEV